MADWSQLPRELLDLISRYLSAEIDVLRFRSICSTWRSAASPPPSAACRFPILPNAGISDTSWGFHLSRRCIYSIQQTRPESPSWIIKLERDNPTRSHLLNPLTRSEFKPLPDYFPKIFDFSHLRIKELGQEYTLQYINFRPLANNIGESGNLYMEKVAVSLNNYENGFVLLTIHVSGRLAVYRSGAKKWTVINDLPSPYDDVIFRKGEFYAVDNTGRIVRVNVGCGQGPSLSIVAKSVFGGDRKFLVDSFGELLLVDMYLSVAPEEDLGYNEGFEFYEEFDCFMSERTVKFKVFRLDEGAGKWVDVSDLGERILFLGDNCTFSALASDYFGGSECKGNCILFTDQFFYSVEDDRAWKSSGVGVFDIGTGTIGPISNYNGYSKMIWPPPSWIHSTVSVEAGVSQLTI